MLHTAEQEAGLASLHRNWLSGSSLEAVKIVALWGRELWQTVSAHTINIYFRTRREDFVIFLSLNRERLCRSRGVSHFSP